jgi:hypothetical protein
MCDQIHRISLAIIEPIVLGGNEKASIDVPIRHPAVIAATAATAAIADTIGGGFKLRDDLIGVGTNWVFNGCFRNSGRHQCGRWLAVDVTGGRDRRGGRFGQQR